MTKPTEARQDELAGIREKIANIIYDYSDIQEYTQGANEILSLTVSSGKCPDCKGKARPNKVTYNLHTGYTVNGRSCRTCGVTGVVEKTLGQLVKEATKE